MPTELRNIREAEGLSQPELAGLAELSVETVRRAEKGSNVSRRTRSRLLNALNGRANRLRTYELTDLFPDESAE